MNNLSNYIRHGIAIRVALSICCNVIASGATSAVEISNIELRGFKIGQSMSEVERIISLKNNIDSEQWVPDKSSLLTAKRLPTAYVRFKDGDFIEIGFVRQQDRFISAEVIEHIFQVSKEKILQRYSLLGRPSQRKLRDGTQVLVWGGEAELQGGVNPSPGSSTSLRLEMNPQGVWSIRLTGHTLLKESKDR